MIKQSLLPRSGDEPEGRSEEEKIIVIARLPRAAEAISKM